MKNNAQTGVYLIFFFLAPIQALTQTLSGSVNSYYHITAVNTAANSVTVSSASGLSAGQRVFLYQAKGAVIDSSNTSTYGDIKSLNGAGAYEFNTICSINGNDLWLLNGMANSYSTGGQVQLVTVPSFSTITVNGTITAPAWASSTGTGGIVVLEAGSTINLNADIDVSGMGFIGGILTNQPVPPYNCSFLDDVADYVLTLPASGDHTGGNKGEGIAAFTASGIYARGKQANGGGGGNNTNTGGAGGGNYGAGGGGGQRAGEGTFNCHGSHPGISGSSLATYGYTTAANRIFLGGGGGSGQENNGVGEPGGNGGGIIFLSAPTINGGGGNLLAYGIQPTNPACTDPYQAEGDGGGGGGAGGTIILNASTITGSISAQVYGGRGSDASNRVTDCTGPGGGGGGGIVWAAGLVFPAAVTVAVNGGSNGVVSSGSSKIACVGSPNGATSGGSGLSKSGYATPLSGGPVCTVLASSVLQYFGANRRGSDVLLNWTLTSPAAADDIRDFLVQRTSDLARFEDIARVAGSPEKASYSYTDADENVPGTLAYRLAWQTTDGAWNYSRILSVSGMPGPDEESFRIYPNPATDLMTLQVVSTTTESAAVSVRNSIGQVVLTQQATLRKGLNSLSISFGPLAPGTYFMVLESAGRHLVRSFIRKNN
jgi:hypothetical protein